MASPILGSFTNAEHGRYDTASVLTGVFRTRKGQSVAAVVLAETLLAEEVTLTIAAKVAARNAFDALEDSIDRPPTELITAAFAAASHAVQHHKSLTGRNALCSMAIALVYGGKTLYIGSIGLTRIYLLRRESGLVQLTMDHTVGNLAIQRGESPARARQRPDSDLVGYALGMDAESTPDIGVYDVSSKAVEAEQRGHEGIPVRGQDAILICTQTVYGISPSGVPFVSDAEIAEVLSKSIGMRAAEILVDVAIDRKPPTTVSVGTMHIRGGSILNPRTRPTLFGIVLLAIVIGLIVLIFANRGSTPEVIRATETRTQAPITATSTQVITPTNIVVTGITPSAVSTVALLPPTAEPTITSTPTISPTASPSITPTPSETADAVLSSELIQILDWDTTGVRSTELTRALDPVTTFDLMIREIRFESASIFLMPNSFVDLHTVSEQAITAAFAQTSSLLVIADANTPVVSMEYMNLRPSVFSIADGCVSLHMISAEMLVASCFAGTCTLSRGFAEQPDVIIPEGQQAIYLPNSAALSSFAPIEPLEVRHYFELLALAESAQACLTPYLRPDLTATPTLTSTATPSSTATRTAVPPTRTRVPSTSTARPSATASASSTSSPTSTFTVTITFTSTLTATVTLTTSASATPSPTPSATETETATFTATATPTSDAVFPTNTPILTETPTPTLYSSPTPNTAISP